MTFEFGDEETENAAFYACGTDNGKNKEAPFDNFYVECTDGCGYNTAVRIMEDSNDISGGNIHLHDAIVDPTPANEPSAAPAASSGKPAANGSAPASGAAPESRQASASDAEAPAQNEPDGSADVITLEPMLLSVVPAGTPMVVTAIVEVHGEFGDGTPVTLRWNTAAGLQGEATALVNDYGMAAFVVTVPEGDVEYAAWVGDLESNGMRITGF